MSTLLTLAAALHLTFALVATLALRESGEPSATTRLSILIVTWLMPVVGPMYVSCGLYANAVPRFEVQGAKGSPGTARAGIPVDRQGEPSPVSRFDKLNALTRSMAAARRDASPYHDESWRNL